METPMFTAEYFPSIPREDIVPACKHVLPLSDISALGSGFAVTAAAIAKAAMSAPDTTGLYRCVFPEGVTGKLASFKDGSGFLGTILNDGSFAGQARWIPADASTVPLGIDPVTLAIAAVMVNITKRLDDIQKTQEDILTFLREDKESQLEGLVNAISSIMEDYYYNSDNELWCGSKLNIVSEAERAAEQNIIFYRKQVTGALAKMRKLHTSGKVNDLGMQLSHDFKYYQMGLYIYAFAQFLEIVLAGNHSSSNLNHISEKISDYAFQYRLDYSACYDQLEHYSQTSVRSKVLEGMGKAGKTVGKAIASIPVVSKGPVDEALIDAGDKLEQFNAKIADQIMSEFRQRQDAGIFIFQENIAAINQLCNSPVEVLFDRNTLYICA